MPKRVDANQPEIVQALRRVGASVHSLAGVGCGCPDLAVGYRGVTYLLEVKGCRGKLTPGQVEWHAEWRGQVAIVRSIDEALETIGAVKC